MKATKLLISTLSLVAILSSIAQANPNSKKAKASETAIGGNSSGGGSPESVSQGALKLLIEGAGLKRAMQNYINTIDVEKIEDDEAKRLFTLLNKHGDLEGDIQTPNNYFVATKEQTCRDAYNKEVPASAEIGKVGGRICFDVEKLTELYKSLNDEEVMIHLAALAFHEHVHHFQKVSQDEKVIKKNEEEANRLAGYVLVTARFVQIPTLQWAPSGVDDFDEIKVLYDKIRAKEKAFLRVPEAFYKNYPDYKDKEDRGLFRLLPRETYDKKLSIQGGGSYYSFSTKSHDYQSIAQISWERGHLRTGFAGCNYGYITKLGNIDLALVTLNFDSKKMQYIRDFVPVGENEPQVRVQQRQSDNGVLVDGVAQGDETRDPDVGDTFALRSITFNGADVLVAFRIIHIDPKDKSLIIAWKKLKTYPIGSCSKR